MSEFRLQEMPGFRGTPLFKHLQSQYGIPGSAGAYSFSIYQGPIDAEDGIRSVQAIVVSGMSEALISEDIGTRLGLHYEDLRNDLVDEDDGTGPKDRTFFAFERSDESACKFTIAVERFQNGNLFLIGLELLRAHFKVKNDPTSADLILTPIRGGCIFIRQLLAGAS